MTSRIDFALIRSRLAPLLITLSLVVTLLPQPANKVQAQATSGINDHALLAQQYGALPLSFLPNFGQTNSAVRFQVRGEGGTLFFTPDEVVLSLSNQTQPTTSRDRINLIRNQHRTKVTTPAALPTVVRLHFEGANTAPTITAADKLPGIVNEFIGKDPTQWHTNIPTYAGIVYQDLYPGIDLHYDGHVGQLKGTYTVAPGADPALIHWQYAGAAGTHLNANNGDLVIDLPDGKTLTEQAPIAWQEYAGQRLPVAARYTQSNTGEIGFALDKYETTLPLVIDPTLIYSTFLGGIDDDQAYAIAVDSSGRAYVTGGTDSTVFPTTGGALQTTFGGGLSNVFVTKLNPAGTALAYSTYLGGSDFDQGYAIAVDSSGNAYITGVTTSIDFPTTVGAFQTSYYAGDDVFVTKLNPTGDALVYSTLLGCDDDEDGNGIAVDSSGNAYVTGFTTSIDFPTTLGAYQTTLNGTSNAFVTKIAPAGDVLVYSTYLGGTGADSDYGIAVDGNGNAYVTGDSTSIDFPTTLNAFQTAFGGDSDITVTKLNPTGDALVYSTYLGGSTYEDSYGIALDSAGNTYVVGDTYSTDFPTTLNAFQTMFGGGYDAFVTKLNPTGSALAYSTYLGGSNVDSAAGIRVDSSGSAYLTGFTYSGNFPTTPNAFHKVSAGSLEAFVTKIDSTGNKLGYSTFLGGSNPDWGTGIALDSNRNAYVAGYTASINFPTTVGAFQTTFGGTTDAFVTKLNANVPFITSVNHATLTVGTVGYFTITAMGSPAPTFSATGLPTWATLNPTTGIITGRPPSTVGSPFAVTITATNGVLPTATQSFTLTVNAGVIDTVGVFRPSAATFYLRNTNTTGPADIATAFGVPTDLPIAGDWNGDGIDTVGIYRPSTGQFSLRNSNTSGAPVIYSFVLGVAGDQPMVGDWDNDGMDGVGVFRPSNGLIYLKNNLTTGFADFQMVLGVPGDMPVSGDWNGDGKDSPGVYRPSLTKFFLSNQVCNCSVFADYSAALGVAGDSPFAGDWNGDGISGIGVFRPSNGLIYLKNTPSTGFADISLTFGIANDQPISGHWAVGSSSPSIQATPKLAPTFVP
ncbi:MAG: SBBP repeat-containing protein [Chloroflexota bacterium]